MGKTPLLPLFAALLGAGEVFLGFIISVSTLTGMVLKPFVGFLSDRWGRRWWLLLGTIFFAGMPFLYRFIHTPEQLLVIRVVHGLATAIYGPVTLAYVLEQKSQQRAERLGIFGMARSAGYIIGPAAAGWLLLSLNPVQVFTIIGFLSCLVFVPVIYLPEIHRTLPRNTPAWRAQIRAAWQSGSRTPAVWLAGGLEAIMYITLYAVRAFLPLYALGQGINVAVVGLFFSVQEAVHLLLKPAGGKLGDGWGYVCAIALGMGVLALAFPLLALANAAWEFMAISMLIGLGQAIAFPSTVALASVQLPAAHLGSGMGLIGTLDNAGKVLGPIIGGLLIAVLSYDVMFASLGLVMGAGAAGLMWANRYHFRAGSLPE